MSEIYAKIVKENNYYLLPMVGFTVIILLTIILYSSINDHIFLFWDDKDYILNNDMLRPLSWKNIVSMFTTFDSANWHPMTWLSYAINFAIWDQSAAAFKWTNVGIHILNCILVYCLTVMIIAFCVNFNIHHQQLKAAFRELQYIIPALIAALLFAVSPQHVESVAWISDRKDILCSFFYLSALACYLYSRNTTDKNFWDHLVLLLFVCALMSKAIAVTLPVVLLFVDYYLLGNNHNDSNKWRVLFRLIKSKISMIMLSGIVAIITVITQNSQIRSIEDFSFFSRATNISINYLYYIGSIVVPNFLSPYHPIPTIVKDPGFVSILPIIAMISLLSLLIYYRNKLGKLLVVTFTLYSIMVLPAIGLVQLAYAARADRYAYMPSFIFYIAFGFYCYRFIIKSIDNLKILTASSTIALCFLAYLSSTTYHYANDWKNDELLWKKVVSMYPDSAAHGYNNLGNVSYDRQDYQDAIAYYKKAIAIEPSLVAVYGNIANAYLKISRTDLAFRYYQDVIRNNPDNPRAYEMLGDFYYKNHKMKVAEDIYRDMLRANPRDPGALIRNSLIDYNHGEYDKALQKIDYYLVFRPSNKKAMALRERILSKSVHEYDIDTLQSTGSESELKD